MDNVEVKGREKTGCSGQKARRGRLTAEEWQARARYVLRYLDDPIALQRSPVCRLGALERMARAKYPNGIVAHGRTLIDLTYTCLQEIEYELNGHTGAAKLKEFVVLTRNGKCVTEASRAIGVSREYACRVLKRHLVELLAEKMQSKVRRIRYVNQHQ